MSSPPDESVVWRALVKAARELLGSLSSSAVDRMAVYYDDPVGFARDILGIEPWGRQREILEAAAKHDRVLVRSGHKVGKSLAAVILALWFVATRRRARVLITAPTFEQIKHIIWRELDIYYPRVGRIMEGPPHLPLDPRTGVAFSGNRQIFGRAARTKEGAAGVSGAEMLFIVDEASGFPDEQYEALKGNAAGGVKIVAFSNPTKASGWFFEGFRNGLWHCIHVSSEESPNVVAALARERAAQRDPNAPMAPRGDQVEHEDEIPGVAGWPWVLEMRRECGVNYRTHPIYQVRVLGEFPSAGPNAIMSLDGVTAARKRWDDHVRRNLEASRAIDHGIWGALELGIDPARFGDDDCVIFPRRGRFLYEPRVLSGRVLGAQIAEAAVQCVRELRRARMDDGPVVVKIDPLGRAGVEAAAAIRAHEAHKNGELVLVEVDVNRAADNEEAYSDLRTQLWFAGAQWIGDGLDEDGNPIPLDAQGPMLPPCPQLTKELLTSTYGFDARGRQLAASKDAMRAILKCSPDHADAFNLAVYRAPHGRTEVLTGSDLERRRRPTEERERGVY